jgi:mevalonate kinase
LSGREYYSKGKFLLSGEYLVLYGAKALALPLKFGQRMKVGAWPEPGIIKWETKVMGKLWFEAAFKVKNFESMDTSDHKTAIFVQQLLKAGDNLGPGLMNINQGYHIQNAIDFELSWGLGSSSSLVSNLAVGLDIDPFVLYRKLFQGSGYDVYCSRADKPILYQLINEIPEVTEVSFRPAFAEHLYFVHLGRKQDSQQSVSQFRKNPDIDINVIGQISELTDWMLEAGSLDEFISVMALHEQVIANVLGLKSVKEERFPDFQGGIKSLGAWGGDFIMAASLLGYQEVKDYFSRKNMPVIFRWDEIVY